MEKRLSLCGPQAAARRKPTGGFCFISGTALISAWWAYRRGFLTPLDLRVWLACFEAVARRYGLRRGRLPHFTVRELRGLVGNQSDDEIRRSIRRLSARGLVFWSQTSVRVGGPLHTRSEAEDRDLAEYLAQVPNHARRVPVPRRVIRFLVRCGTRVILATVFGHLLRCLYYRAGECRPTGTCKATWIAELFAVDVRNVKAARQALVQQGLLQFEAVGQKFLNRHGPLVTVNLEWAPLLPEPRQLPPRAAAPRGDSPPLIRKHKLLRILTNQNRAPRRAPGADVIEADIRMEPKPSLRYVAVADLTNRTRLTCLFEQACAAGYLQPTESDQLNFFAMAEHAQAAGTRNVPGLFAANVRHRRWQVLTLADEDAARRRLSVLGARRLQRVSASRPSGRDTRSPATIGAVVGRVMETLARNVAAGRGQPGGR